MKKLSKYELDILIEKYHLGTCTEAEEVLLNDWFENVTVIEDLTFVSDEERNEIGTGIKSAVLKETGVISSRRVSFRSAFLRIAAVLIIGIFAIGTYFYLNNAQSDAELITINVPSAIEKMPVTLPDGSEAWLKGGSSISYPHSFEGSDFRKITLDGIAYFSIKPDKNVPFIVNTTKSISVKVLGTSFVVDVQKELQNVKVSVITGIVQVNNDNTVLSDLTPGERLNYSYLTKSFSRENYLKNEMEPWQDDNRVVSLNAVSLEELAFFLRTRYAVDLAFDEKETVNYKFTISFADDITLDEILNMLETTSGLDFVRKGTKITVVRQ